MIALTPFIPASTQKAWASFGYKDKVEEHDYSEIPGSKRKGPVEITLDTIREHTIAKVFGGRVFLDILMQSTGVPEAVARDFFVNILDIIFVLMEFIFLHTKNG